MTTIKDMLRKYVGQEISVYGEWANVSGVLKEVLDDVAIMDTKHSHNNYVRIDAINSFNKPNEEDETITDFTVLIDKVVEHMRANSLTKLNFVEDMVHVGFLCLEDGKLFQMTRTDAYNSVNSYDDKEKDLFMQALDQHYSVEKCGIGSDQSRTALIQAIVGKVLRSKNDLDDLVEVDVVYRNKKDLANNDYKDDGPGWYVWEHDYYDEGYVGFFDHDPTDAEIKQICPTYVRSK